MASKGNIGIIVCLLLGVVVLTLVLLPSGAGNNSSIATPNQVFPGKGENMQTVGDQEHNNRNQERKRNDSGDHKRKRPTAHQNGVEYEGKEIYDAKGIAKQIVFKVNNREKISLLSSDPSPVDWQKPFVLLLHDAQSSARVWDELGTMEALMKEGFRVRALNLPGRGETTTFQQHIDDKGLWMREVMDDFGLYPFVIVLPSTGAVYGAPFIRSLFDYNNQHALVGVVAVGPTAMPPIAKLAPRPCLFLYGENDPLYLRDANRLQGLDHVVLQTIEGASHKAWEDNPVMFNELLVSWLLSAL